VFLLGVYVCVWVGGWVCVCCAGMEARAVCMLDVIFLSLGASISDLDFVSLVLLGGLLKPFMLNCLVFKGSTLKRTFVEQVVVSRAVNLHVSVF
jgi:hypothetical protein